MTGSGVSGRVSRVNGPVLQVRLLPGVAMADLVEVGAARLPGEVVELSPDQVTVQVYEYTGGVRPGDPVVPLGRPLAAPLGPGLLGGIFDGLLRPLTGAGQWLWPGATRSGAAAPVEFTPQVAVGERVPAGAVLGQVGGQGPLPHLVLSPPGLGGEVTAVEPAGRYPADAVVARVDDQPVALTQWWPVRRARPYRERLDGAVPLVTGQRVLDAVYPVARGASAAVPGGFGTGKTVLLQQIAKWCDADVIVYVGCGERGNELSDVLAEFADLTDPRTGGRLSERTVVIANTSNMPIMAREASIYTGVTVAEYYRDMGHDAVVIADSTSRWAEALREFASRTGALPAEEGYPAGLASALAAFYERAGRVVTGSGREGSVTIIGAVSPPGGDLTEPVTAHTQRFVRAVWSLDRELAYARHYPAVAWTGSYSRDADAIGGWQVRHGDSGWPSRRARAVRLLADADRLSAMAELVGITALPARERVVLLAARLLREGVLQQNALSATDARCSPERGAALLELVLRVFDLCRDLVAGGVAAEAIEAVDFTPVLRAREEAGELALLRQRDRQITAMLRELR